MLGLGSSLISSGAVSEPPRVLIASYDFNNDSLNGPSATFPSGLGRPSTGAVTIFGSTTSTNQRWFTDDVTTASGGTGPSGGHVGGPDTLDTVITDGTWDSSSAHRYVQFEATTNGTGHATSFHTRQVINISTVSSPFLNLTTAEMTFWFNVFGSDFGDDVGLGIAVTNSATDASSVAELVTGLGFTSDTAGGASINYTALDGSSVSTNRLGHAGQIQTTGHGAALADNNKWIKATVDLDAACGEGTVVIHFCMFTTLGGNAFKQDMCIDSISIIGQ